MSTELLKTKPRISKRCLYSLPRPRKSCTQPNQPNDAYQSICMHVDSDSAHPFSCLVSLPQLLVRRRRGKVELSGGSGMKIASTERVLRYGLERLTRIRLRWSEWSSRCGWVGGCVEVRVAAWSCFGFVVQNVQRTLAQHDCLSLLP